MSIALPPVLVQKLNVIGIVRAARAGARHGHAFERAYEAGQYGRAFTAARHARRLARRHGVAGHSALAGARLHGAHVGTRRGFREGFESSRGVSNRLILRTAISRRLPVPLSMRAGFIAGAARNRLIRVRDPSVAGGGYLRRAPA